MEEIGGKTITIIILVIFIVWLIMREPTYVSPEEKAVCLKETGNIYCNGPRGD